MKTPTPRVRPWPYVLTTVLTALWFWSLSAHGQFYSRELPTDNVMNSHHIRSVAQDQKGFLWMGSTNGLFRYDGYHYQRMREMTHPELLPDESVMSIQSWGTRFLWIRLRGELHSCYDTELERFVSWNSDMSHQVSYRRCVIADANNLWLYDPRHGCCHVTVSPDGTVHSQAFRADDKTLPSNEVTFVVQETPERAWVGTAKGLVSIRQGRSHMVAKGQQMVCAQPMGEGEGTCFVTRDGCVYQTQHTGSLSIFTPKAPPASPVRDVAREGHQLILATEGATYLYDTRQRQLTLHPTIHIDHAQVVETSRHNKMFFDRYGQDIYYLTPHQTYHLQNIYSRELTKRNGTGRFSFVEGSNGRLWISTYGNGLFAYDPKTGQLTHYAHGGGNSAGVHQPLTSTDFLLGLFEDLGGNLWVCQENYGMCRINEVNQQCDVRYFTTAADQSHANTIRLIQPIGEHVLVGNRQNALWTTDATLSTIETTNPYADDVVAATTDREGRLWVGTRNRGIFVDGQPLEPAVKGKVSDLLCDRRGRMWISIFNGSVLMVTRQPDGTFHTRNFFEGQHAIAQPRSMVEDRKGRIWLCSNKGVYMFSPEALCKSDSAYLHISVAGLNSNSDEVHCLCLDATGHLWAGTTGYGLALIDSTGHVTRRYTDQDGLPNNNIESIITDATGTLWVGTGYGLAKYVPQEDRFYAFFLGATAQGLMYTEGCATLLNDGRLAMGTLHGIQVFAPEQITPRASIFPLQITNIRVNGVALNDDSTDDIELTKRTDGQSLLRLSHDQNSLTFNFSAFSYVNTQLTRYSYWLEGYDREWSAPKSQNEASFQHLRPGSYTLHVRSYNSHGVLNEHEATLHIVISQPWWNTWWAWLIYIAIAATAAYTFWRHLHQLEELRTRIKVENQLTEFKLRFFTNVSHEFRTPLTIIRGAMDRINAQGEMPGALKQPIASMQKSTTRLLRLVNELMEFRKIQNQQFRLSLEETDLVGFLRSIFLTFNEMAENREMSYQFTTPVRDYKIYIDRSFVEKMAYNLLSNAFKYTTRRQSITMRLTLDEMVRKVTFEVEDTGIGVPPEKRGQLFTRFNQSAASRDSIGIGLHMVHELVLVHHGDIRFRENPAGGSIFSITLPTDPAVYQPDDFLDSESQLLLEGYEESQPTGEGLATYKEMQSQPLNDRLVMLVEDDDELRDHLAGELRRYFNVATAEDGADALSQMAAQRPDIVVSDVRMPNMTGFELVQKIRKDPELDDVPVVLMSGIDDEEKAVRGTEYGADDYLYKPFNMRVLAAKCSALIKKHERLRIRYAKEVVGSTPIADIIMEDTDKKFLERFEAWVYNNTGRSSMQAIEFANSMKIGRTTFFKKVKQLTGMPPHEYIKKIRMAQAAELLRDPTLSISEVAYRTGFDDPNYFSRIFKDYYGMTASQYKKGGVTTKETPSTDE